MKILIITPFYDPYVVGGAEISCQIMAEGLAKRGHEVTVLTVGYSNENGEKNGVLVIHFEDKIEIQVWESKLKSKKCNRISRILHLKNDLYSNKKYIKKYKEFFLSYNADVVIMNSSEGCLWRASLWKALNKLSIPTILTFRDDMLIHKNIGILLPLYRKHILNQAKWIRFFAAPSEFMFNLHVDAGFKISVKKIIYNTVDIDQYYQNNKKRQIIYAGTIGEYKGVLTLLSAVNILFDKYGKDYFNLLLVGKNLIPDKVKSENGITVINWLSRGDLYKIMQESLITILPSEWSEAFGRVLVESVYNGTLAVGSSAGAIPELFDNDERYVFPMKDAKKLAEKIERILLLSEDSYYREIIEMQEKWRKFSVDNYVDNWEKYCNYVMNYK